MNAGPATGGSSSGGAASGGTGGGSNSGGPQEPAPDCELFRDQSPPPDVRTISITNIGEVPVYIQPFMLDCTAPTSLVQVERDGETVNVHGIRNCGLSCEEALNQGWRLAPPCFADCDAPQLVQILPGQTVQQPVNLEVSALDLPQACAAGIERPSERCFGRVIPQPAEYTLTVRALMEQPCSEGPACECRPDDDGRCSVEFSDRLMRSQAAVAFPFPSGWYYQSQQLTIGLPTF